MSDFTTNYVLYKPDDTVLMSSPVPFMKTNWDKIEAIPRQPIVASLPTTTFTYTHGDRVYLQGYKSTFVCMGSNADWGVFWRPVHVKYGPWINLPVTILKDQVNYQMDGASPLSYRMTNDGRIIMRGAIGRVSGVFPDYEATVTDLDLIKSCANTEGFQVRPSHRGTWEIAGTPQPATPTKAHVAMFVMENTGASYMRVFNNSAICTVVYFAGVEWDIADNDGYGF